MRTVADLVIDRLGRISVWIDKTAATAYAALPRIAGRVEDLVSRIEAEQEAKEAYQRGLEAGKLLVQPDEPPSQGFSADFDASLRRHLLNRHD